jgi:hypothetical protein
MRAASANLFQIFDPDFATLIRATLAGVVTQSVGRRNCRSPPERGGMRERSGRRGLAPDLAALIRATLAAYISTISAFSAT